MQFYVEITRVVPCRSRTVYLNRPCPTPRTSQFSRALPLQRRGNPWLLDASAVRHKEARTERSCKTRVYFRCTDEECAFSCHINKGGDGVFRVTKLVWHSCGPFNKAKVKRAWVTEKAKAMIGERDGLKPKELQDRLRERHGVDVKIRAATKAVAQAKRTRKMKNPPLTSLSVCS